MGLVDTIRNQNYGGILFNKNNPNALGGGGVQGTYDDEVYKGMSPIEAAAKSITTMREQTRKRSNEQVISDLLASQNTMFGQAVSNRNKATSKEEMKAAQLDAFAAIVKGRAIEDGYEDEWEPYNTTKDIMQHYIELNNSPAINKRLVQYADSQENPYDFALSLGVLLSPEEKKIRSMQSDLDLLFGKGNTHRWLAKTVDFLGNDIRGGLSSWTNQMEKGDFNEMTSMSDSDEAPIVGAIENYAYRTFGKHINNLDEYELNKILIDLQDIETLKKYLPNEATAVANKIEGGIYGVAESMFPMATLGLEGLSSVPVVGDITSGILSTISIALGATLANTVLAPLGIPLEVNMNNREERKDLYEALGVLGFLYAGGDTKWNKGTTDGFVKWLEPKLQNISLDNIAKSFKESKKRREESRKKEKEAYEQKRQVASQRIMEDLAGTLLEPEERGLKPDLANGLSNLPSRVLKGPGQAKTFDSITRETRDAQGGVVELQNAILDQVKQKFGPENDIFTTENGATIHPVYDAIQLLRMLFDKQPDNLAKLAKYEEKYKKGEITALDKKNLAREISINGDAFDDNFHQKNGTNKKYIESVRDGLQNDIKNIHPFINEFLTQTDSVYNNLSKVKKYANKKADEVSSIRDKQKVPTLLRKAWGGARPVGKVIDTALKGGTNIYKEIDKNVREPYNPTTLEKDIPRILNSFAEEKSKIPGKGFNISAFMDLIDEWNYKPESYKYEVDPRGFLEDIVESSDITKEKTEALGNKYPSLGSLLKRLGATEEEVAAMQEAFNITQESLFPDMPSKESKSNKSKESKSNKSKESKSKKKN